MLSVLFYVFIVLSQIKDVYSSQIDFFIATLKNGGNRYTFTKHTFKELDIINDDVILKGINPSFVFFLPTKSNLVVATITLNLKTSPYLRDDASLDVSIEDIPLKYIKIKNFSGVVKFSVYPNFPKEFVKITINSYLRVSNNICEDIFSNKSYFVISKNSYIEFKSLVPDSVENFIDDYYNKFAITDYRLLPLVYYLSAKNAVYPRFVWKNIEDVISRENIEKENANIANLASYAKKLQGLDVLLEKSLLDDSQTNYKTYTKPEISKNIDEYNNLNVYSNNSNNELKTLDVDYKLPPNNSIKEIVYSDKIVLEGCNLFVNDLFIKAIENSYNSVLFGRSINLYDVKSNVSLDKVTEMSLREMGIKSLTAYGPMHAEVSIPIRFSEFGGIPDDLYLNLKIAHSTVFHREHAEIRVLINDIMVKAIQIEGSGEKSFDIKLPIREFNFGNNVLRVLFVKQINPEYCKGSLQSIAFTLFDSSYFYWNSSRNLVRTISEFFQMANGDLDIYLEDKSIIPILVEFLNRLGRINKSITKIRLYDICSNENKLSNSLENETLTSSYIIKLVKNFNHNTSNITSEDKKHNQDSNFYIINPLNNEVVFRASYSKPFVALYLNNKKNKPELVISKFGEPDCGKLASVYSLDDILRTSGNILVMAENYFASFEVGKKFKLVFENEKGISYYWNKYKLYILIFIGIVGLVIFGYSYKKLSELPLELKSGNS